ncbi:hypothetical protein EGH24_03905 [Halonotius terrestris]|uniref:Uncharacterized protein n=1 Tax=Halonotius terrestris TaxID=2487750 RepID=A0A8J8TD15_9EURY|nr:hypothetical protein [Halonotius terrestris]TQQ82606.1 hypothetical protein EGH24_03905 [Halonotius terrestris]
MPVSYTQEVHGLEITAEPVEEPSPVLWTDTEPTIDVEFNNTTDNTWTADTAVHLRTQIDDNIVWSEEVEIGADLPPGESTNVSVDAKPLTYEGHAVLGFSISGGVNVNNENHPSSLNPGGDDYLIRPTSAFSVWDKSHYDATVRRPKQFQKGIIFTSIVLIIFAGIQLWLAYA